MGRRRGAWLTAVLALSCAARPSTSVAPTATRPAQPAPEVAPAEAVSPPSRETVARAAHVLDRLAHGARPGEVRTVAGNVDAWIDRQLHPESIDDSVFEAELREHFGDLELGIVELRARYPDVPKHLRKPQQRHSGQLVELLFAAKISRALGSERQLEEVLVDFWFNHFNVYAGKREVRWSVVDYERRALRPHVFGSFRELLGQTARHPAMLYYLDNWQSSAPREAQGKRKSAGLNENYGRELLELHTLGVDGGYTQADVREVALALTGWTISADRGSFEFREGMHAAGKKHVLDLEIERGGQADGEAVLDLLALHPSTARFVSRKLAQKFVADEPPTSLVERLAGTFLSTQGDLRAVYADLFASAEFRGSQAEKTKTPLELVVSALRATGARYDGQAGLAKTFERMGQPLYRAEAPTGYREVAQGWVNSGGLVARLNFGLDLAAGALPGVSYDGSLLFTGLETPRAQAIVEGLAERVLSRSLSPATEQVILASLEGEAEAQVGEDAFLKQRQALGLLLGSPEFQKQ